MATAFWPLQAQSQSSSADLSLSAKECIYRALEHNLDIQIERITPVIRELALEAAYQPYEPSLRSQSTRSFSRSPGQVDPVSNLTYPGNDTTRDVYSNSINGRIASGMSYNMAVEVNRTTGTRFLVPQYSTSASINLQQPLLKNFLIDSASRNIRLSRISLRMSKLALSGKVTDIVTQVLTAYYDLIHAYENIKVQEQGLDLAQRLLEDNQRRVESGVMAPLDIKQAESDLASRETDLLTARQTLVRQQNILKQLISDDYSSLHGRSIRPSETLLSLKDTRGLHSSWQRALDERTDLLQLRDELEKQDIEIRYSRNQVLPALDLVTSFGLNGLDSKLTRGFGDITGGDNPNYSAGFVLTIPLSNRAAKANLKSSRESKKAALLNLKRLEQSILAEIDNGFHETNTQFNRVHSARTARRYAEAVLEAEEKKLSNGATTSYVVLQLQRDVTSARLIELRAITDYNKAQAQFSKSENSTLERQQIIIK
ncbi:TolC family protein [Verrucomicrobia bacterium]|nr:TolC family protein [Verrucomicrobiota bacterium]